MHTKLLTVVISLVRATERRAKISMALAAHKIDYQFLDAVDGSSGIDFSKHPDVDIAGTLREMGQPMLAGEYGCALSHIEAYRLFLASDASHLLVLEDDAEIRPELKRFIDTESYARKPMFLLHHRVAWAQRHREITLFDKVKAVALANTPTMAAAYTLNREAATRLLEKAVPVRRVADWPMDIPELDAWAAIPMPVGHPPFSEAGKQSMIGTKRTYENRRPYHPLLSAGFFRRKWRRIGAYKIS